MSSDRPHGAGWKWALDAGLALLTVGVALVRPGPGRGGKEPAPSPASTPPTDRFDQKWLEAFYKECGREVTLAYTTLNQMKNWAMIVVAAAISGLSFGTASDTYPNVPMFVG